MAVCSKCNNQIEDGAMFCEHCGAEVDKEEYTPKGGYDFSKVKAIAIAVSVIAIIGIIVFAILKITGGSGVSAHDYVNSWNGYVQSEKDDLSGVYKNTIVEDMLTELDVNDADKSGSTYEFELYEAYNDDQAILAIETEGIGTVNEVQVVMEEGVFETFVNEFYYEEDAVDGFKLIHTLALSSMFSNKAAYRDAAEIVDEVWDDFLEDQSKYYDEYDDAWVLDRTYDDVQITLEIADGTDNMTFTAKRV